MFRSDVLCVFLPLLIEAAAEGLVQEKPIRAVEGGTVDLSCKAPDDKMEILVIKWSRPDLGKENDVFLYRNGKINPDNHPSYKNRVKLKDRDMKDGDVSLIVKNVAFNDSGTFQCFIKQEGENNENSPMNLISLISLTVAPPSGPGGDGGTEDGPSRGRDALTVGLTVAALVVGLIVGVVLFLRYRRRKNSPPLPPPPPPPEEITLNPSD